MKKILFLLLATTILISSSCITDSKQESSKIFSEYEGENGFLIFNLPPALLKMFIKSDSINNEKLITKLDIIQVIVFDENENSRQYQKVLEEINNKISLSEFKLISNISEENENINIFAINKETQIREILLTITNGNEFIALDFVGDMSIKDVVNLANKIDEENIKNFSINN
ncbi:MAG: DUF4252 domain-containing protein [Bacteroidota bacterium]|nr:DUF4252 domain-containing protein [Bacteroidota bacterium]